ncbi:3-deoxy-manno-octulosonate cytidylyltransferase [Helicobacter sp. MIT 14-3879]|uniref:3-deoxy-manno-octulosonate cytidylyltransferase n=1 Tax=Helicobacter sp. MIT 14-3879 TaxID=2040649 RepID=UPI000E1EF307|nr:3-deoxy-manno-octulosonate cytidylyltransferase [Helicobacter sp. MIT 14-3879]RDU65190.1 3-deoxy-manno-octulosonate cytidylyltransferase [Helicobacter sp. MIT 14-3879]
MIIIPARLKSTRLPNKLLLPLNGIPIIVCVANIANKVDKSIVACDDAKIVKICNEYGVDSILTSSKHTSGTDRCAEVVEKLGLNDDEVIINLQGDEPFIETNIIENLKKTMENKKNEVFMSSCYKIIDSNKASDSNIVKVVLNSHSYAMYFSRRKIPYDRDDIKTSYFGHLGIYAFSAKSLREFCKLPQSPLEEVEKLEQLRALWHNKKIFMLEVSTDSIGIDTLEDYQNAKNRSELC